jgi:isoleucyl-tRNA synthetase
MPYSTACTTPLANFEAPSNYQNVSDRTVIVKFKLKNTNDIYILSWTTTPWTLPGNVALAVNPKFDYAEIEKLSARFKQISDQIDTREIRWLELSDLFE